MDMEYDVKKEARKQYLNYFKMWFIVAGILFVLSAVILIGKVLKSNYVERTNGQAPEERVFDNADVLSQEEEENLRKKIAKAEKKIMCDIVVVTIEQPVEGKDAQQKYNYRYDDWEMNMTDLADDFYDEYNFGYDNDDYDGVLLLDNWYEDSNGSQMGSWLSTSGKVYEQFGNAQVNEVLDRVYYSLDSGSSPYKAYCLYVDTVVSLMSSGPSAVTMLGIVVIAVIVSVLSMVIFIPVNMKNKAGEVTVNVSTYVNGNTRMNAQQDEFIRKSVSSTRISTESSSSGGGSSSSSGRGGSHHSSSGRTHGGGGRRR